MATSAATSQTRAVVDGVLDAVGDRRVGLAELEADVEDQPLADLALGRRHAVMGVQRQPVDLDRHDGLDAIVVVEVVVV